MKSGASITHPSFDKSVARLGLDRSKVTGRCLCSTFDGSTQLQGKPDKLLQR